MVSQRIMSQFISSNCIQTARGTFKDTWELTSKFSELLRQFVRENKKQ